MSIRWAETDARDDEDYVTPHMTAHSWMADGGWREGSINMSWCNFTSISGLFLLELVPPASEAASEAAF